MVFGELLKVGARPIREFPVTQIKQCHFILAVEKLQYVLVAENKVACSGAAGAGVENFVYHFFEVAERMCERTRRPARKFLVHQPVELGDGEDMCVDVVRAKQCR